MIDQPAGYGAEDQQRATRHPQYAGHPAYGVLLVVDLFGKCFDGGLQPPCGFPKLHDRLQGKTMVGAHRTGGFERRTPRTRGTRLRPVAGVRLSHRDPPTAFDQSIPKCPDHASRNSSPRSRRSSLPTCHPHPGRSPLPACRYSFALKQAIDCPQFARHLPETGVRAPRPTRRWSSSSRQEIWTFAVVTLGPGLRIEPQRAQSRASGECEAESIRHTDSRMKHPIHVDPGVAPRSCAVPRPGGTGGAFRTTWMLGSSTAATGPGLRHAAFGDSTAVLNRCNSSASRRSASSMLRAFT